MRLLRWAESTRDELRTALPEALVVLPMGATEQHGPHLATGTDALLAVTIAERAAERAVTIAERDLVIAPPLAFGASDHHLPFGGTLSLSASTAIEVLGDLARSIVESAGRRLVLVNGHGGNRGVCHVAASTASARYGLAVTVLHYWELLDAQRTPIPGHAGEFETAMLLAVDPALVGARAPRPPLPEESTVEGCDMHDPAAWLRIDGYTDDPAEATAEAGQRWLADCVSALADRLVRLTRLP